METRICLDTDVLANILRGHEKELIFLQESEQTALLATTMINVFELYYGAFLRGNVQDLSGVQALLDRLFVLPLSTEAARGAGQIKAVLDKKGVGVDFRDVLIAAIVLQNGYAFKTGNIKHFERIQGLRLV